MGVRACVRVRVGGGMVGGRAGARAVGARTATRHNTHSGALKDTLDALARVVGGASFLAHASHRSARATLPAPLCPRRSARPTQASMVGRQEMLGQTSARLKALAERHQVPVLVTNQARARVLSS